MNSLYNSQERPQGHFVSEKKKNLKRYPYITSGNDKEMENSLVIGWWD